MLIAEFVIVAQLVEWLLPTPKVSSSNADNCKRILPTIHCQPHWKDEIIEKEVRLARILKIQNFNLPRFRGRCIALGRRSHPTCWVFSSSSSRKTVKIVSSVIMTKDFYPHWVMGIWMQRTLTLGEVSLFRFCCFAHVEWTPDLLV